VNPEILEKSGSQIDSEGCLSLPGLRGDVDRAEHVTICGLNRQGEMVTLETHGYLARCALHEVDHLDGVLFIDYLKPSEIIYTAEKGPHKE
jgi:peptide deformylase